MVKRGGISTAEKYYIRENPDKLTLEELAKLLDRGEKAVSKYMTQVSKEPEEPTESVKKRRNKSGMAHKREATVMTEAASQRSDEMRKNRLGKKLSDKLKSSIFKPFADE